MRRALKELDAEVCLELMHCTAQRRLGHVEPCCCTADVAFLGNGDEVSEPAQVHTPGRYSLIPARYEANAKGLGPACLLGATIETANEATATGQRPELPSTSGSCERTTNHDLRQARDRFHPR